MWDVPRSSGSSRAYDEEDESLQDYDEHADDSSENDGYRDLSDGTVSW